MLLFYYRFFGQNSSTLAHSGSRTVHSISIYQSQNRKGCKADPLLKSQGSRHSRLYNSCSFSTCRWTTVPGHLVIVLLDWLQWWTKVAISSEKRENFEIFLCPRWIFFFKKYIQKHFKSGFLYVLDDSEMIWEKNIFSIFRTKFLDFGSLWRPHRTVNQYILLVVLSLPIDEQLCQRISSLHYWFGCSDSPKLTISSKNAIFAICGHFWAWPLWATFWIYIFKLS